MQMQCIHENHVIRRIYNGDKIREQMIELQVQDEEIQKLLTNNDHNDEKNSKYEPIDQVIY